jgi:hypothetical protein
VRVVWACRHTSSFSWCTARALEGYAREYGVHHPTEEFSSDETARGVRLSPVHGTQHNAMQLRCGKAARIVWKAAASDMGVPTLLLFVLTRYGDIPGRCACMFVCVMGWADCVAGAGAVFGAVGPSGFERPLHFTGQGQSTAASGTGEEEEAEGGDFMFHTEEELSFDARNMGTMRIRLDSIGASACLRHPLYTARTFLTTAHYSTCRIGRWFVPSAIARH